MLHQQGFLRFRVDVCTQQPLVVPDFGGSMLRGALGHALAYVDQSAYAKLFDTGQGHTFIITPPSPQRLSAGSCFSFYVTLFPKVASLYEVFFRALDLALRKGLTCMQVPCELIGYKQEEIEFSPLPNKFRLNLLSPWFVKYRNQPVTAPHFNLSTFLIALVRRQNDLVKRGYLQAELPSNSVLLALANDLDCRLQLYNVKGNRRSNRQQTKHPLQGVAGSLQLDVSHQADLQLLSPLLRRAEWLHGGSKVSFGQGALQVQPIHSSVSQLEQLRQIATGAAL